MLLSKNKAKVIKNSASQTIKQKIIVFVKAGTASFSNTFTRFHHTKTFLSEVPNQQHDRWEFINILTCFMIETSIPMLAQKKKTHPTDYSAIASLLKGFYNDDVSRRRFWRVRCG